MRRSEGVTSEPWNLASALYIWLPVATIGRKATTGIGNSLVVIRPGDQHASDDALVVLGAAVVAPAAAERPAEAASPACAKRSSNTAQKLLECFTLGGTLGNDLALDIPVTSVAQEVGQQLAATPDLVCGSRPGPFAARRRRATFSPRRALGTDGSKVIMVGAHRHSVDQGPGIPFGGLFTGDESIKTPKEAAIWGGIAG